MSSQITLILFNYTATWKKTLTLSHGLSVGKERLCLQSSRKPKHWLLVLQGCCGYFSALQDYFRSHIWFCPALNVGCLRVRKFADQLAQHQTNLQIDLCQLPVTHNACYSPRHSLVSSCGVPHSLNAKNQVPRRYQSLPWGKLVKNVQRLPLPVIYRGNAKIWADLKPDDQDQMAGNQNIGTPSW